MKRIPPRQTGRSAHLTDLSKKSPVCSVWYCVVTYDTIKYISPAVVIFVSHPLASPLFVATNKKPKQGGGARLVFYIVHIIIIFSKGFDNADKISTLHP